MEYISTPFLTGKAREAFLRLPIDDSKNYDIIKKAILNRFNLNSEQYRKSF